MAELREARDVRDPRPSGIIQRSSPLKETGTIPKRPIAAAAASGVNETDERKLGNGNDSRTGDRPLSQAAQILNSQGASVGTFTVHSQGLRREGEGGEGDARGTREGEGARVRAEAGGMARREESLIREGLISSGRDGMTTTVTMAMIEDSRERRRTREAHLQDVQERGTNQAVEQLMEEMIRVQRRVREEKKKERRNY